LKYLLEKVEPILERYGDFAALLGQDTENETGFKSLRQSEKTGRPLGSEEWMEKLEKITGTVLKPQKRGPKKRDRNDK
jgi:putative transposase